MKGSWSDFNEIDWLSRDVPQRSQREQHQQKLRQLVQQEKQNHTTITVPQDIALQICTDIRQELQTQLLSRQRVSCAMCILMGEHNLPRKLANSSETSCGCPNVTRQYALNYATITS